MELVKDSTYMKNQPSLILMTTPPIRKLPKKNSSRDFLAGLEIIKAQGKESGWSDQMIAQQITHFANDWQGRRHSDLIKRHRKYEI